MEKSALRKIYLEKRKNLPEEIWIQKCRQIKNQLFNYFDFSSIHTVHCFLPMAGKKEIDTWPIIKALQQKHIRVVVSKSNLQNTSMEHYLLTPTTEIQNNAWGIPEPVSGETIAIHDIDMVMVPLLAFDHFGHRVGYGKGFYDRFLAQCIPATRKIGLSLQSPVEKIEDAGPHDILLDYCVTPEKVWKFSA